MFAALLGVWLFSVTASSYDNECRWTPASQRLLVEKPASCPLEEVRQPIQSENHSIWSAMPYCIEKPGWEFCAHTTKKFRGHGLSIIANPTAAKAASEAFEPARKAPHYSPDSIVEVRDIPGKGKGLVAKRRIKKGRIIMLDSPALVVSSKLPLLASSSEGLQLLSTAVEALPKADRDRVYALDKSMGGAGVDDILKTNSFACQYHDGGVGEGYMCLFPSVSRINHACRPNAYARFAPRTLLMEIKALRDIAPGEEISISYGTINKLHAERQKLYKEGWSFTCTCDMCTADSYAIAGSDQRRTRFSQLREKLNAVTAETYDAQQIIAWEKEVIELSDKEGYEVLIAEEFERMAYVYQGLGKLKEARSWAQKAKDNVLAWIATDGGANNELERVESLLNELGG